MYLNVIRSYPLVSLSRGSGNAYTIKCNVDTVECYLKCTLSPTSFQGLFPMWSRAHQPQRKKPRERSCIETNLVPRAFPMWFPSSSWKKKKKLEESKARRIRKSRTMKWQVIWICWMTWFKLQTRYPTGQLSHCLSYSSKKWDASALFDAKKF